MNKKHLRTAIFALLLVSTFTEFRTNQALGQVLPERPGFSSGTSIVTPEKIQLETGYTFGKAAAEVQNIGDLLLRKAIAEYSELRIGGISYFIQDAESDDSRGMLNPALEWKWQWFRSLDQQTSSSLLLGSTLPIGDHEVASDKTEPRVKFAWAHLMPDFIPGDLELPVTVYGNFNFAMIDYEDDYAFENGSSIATSFALNESLSFFVETYGIFSNEYENSAVGYFDGGFAWLFNKDVQFDLSLGQGFNESRDGWFVNSGFAIAF
jgi:hypothetical protein